MGMTCKNHPERPAAWECVSCHGVFCEECLNIQNVQNLIIQSCKACGGRCKPVGEKKAEIEKAEERKSFFEMMPDAFVYPLRGSGKLLIIIGVIFFGIMCYVSLLNLWRSYIPLFNEKRRILRAVLLSSLVAFLISIATVNMISFLPFYFWILIALCASFVNISKNGAGQGVK